jgi:hypothetical protein
MNSNRVFEAAIRAAKNLLWQNLQATYKLTIELGGVRSAVVVQMLKENELAGAFVIYRQEVNPFTEKQIELVKNFAWTSHASFRDRAAPNITGSGMVLCCNGK